MTAEKDQTVRRRELAERAGLGPGGSASFREMRTGSCGWEPAPAPSSLLLPQTPDLPAALRPRAPRALRWQHSLGVSCPPIKGFAGLTVLRNSGQMLCSSRQRGGKTLLTGHETPAAGRVVVPVCWDHLGWRGTGRAVAAEWALPLPRLLCVCRLPPAGREQARPDFS